jgi:hypothetical protein
VNAGLRVPRVKRVDLGRGEHAEILVGVEMGKPIRDGAARHGCRLPAASADVFVDPLELDREDGVPGHDRLQRGDLREERGREPVGLLDVVESPVANASDGGKQILVEILAESDRRDGHALACEDLREAGKVVELARAFRGRTVGHEDQPVDRRRPGVTAELRGTLVERVVERGAARRFDLREDAVDVARLVTTPGLDHGLDLGAEEDNGYDVPVGERIKAGGDGATHGLHGLSRHRAGAIEDERDVADDRRSRVVGRRDGPDAGLDVGLAVEALAIGVAVHSRLERDRRLRVDRAEGGHQQKDNNGGRAHRGAMLYERPREGVMAM